MINKDTFKKLLTKLEFTENKEVYTKQFDNFELKADFKKEELVYPSELIINEKQTCNFSSNENSVVFECVHRLFEKGYLPKHIELEPKWKLGHGASGGRADIWIKDNDEKSLLIIECKTAGKEYDNAWKDTLEDGGQLFSYFQQEKSTQFLALYASEFTDNEIKIDYKLIAVLDNEEYLKSFGKKDVTSFKTADTVKKIFKAWAETYQKDFATKGLFENDIPAYHIGKTKYSAADLKEVDNEAIQKKYHEFATILRQHNVSGHENAFDKLVNLFLAKIVDETTNKEELAFYWKGAAYDDVKSLIDRLQKHYKIGMEKFLKEDVTYIEKSQIDDAFKFFKNKPDATKAKVLEYFDQLKYYTNNDFAFIDVHNEKLFYQNSIVLLKIVQMLQDIRLQTDTQNQFLGDLFEGFLDKGVKQSEGQFFTPMPIVKFLISALPLENLISENPEVPKVIDYACGAGHFLNEYAHQILPFVKKTHTTEKSKVTIYDPQKTKEYFSQIVGIEKEYRLSKVAKVSAFMYGQDNIEIVYADALAKNETIKDGTFSVLVANPPYNVKGFLETLNDESLERFELFKSIDDKQKKTNNSIECFFVERAKQLLKPNGVAAIVLPSSVLSNGNIYSKMREILLKYFDLVAIAEFGSGTFGKTGTNTATLFLRRKDNNPDFAEHFKNCVDAWFENDFEYTAHYKIPTIEWLDNYCAKIGVNIEDYKTLLSETPNENLFNTELFKDYRKAFENSTDYKNIQKKKLTDKYTKINKETETQNVFLKFLQIIEKEKLYYFMLAKSNPQPVCLVKSPADNKAIKNFLGYEWSSAKGNEGIKYLNTIITDEDDLISVTKGINQIKTPLFNPTNLSDDTKINSIIRANFAGEKPTENEFVSFAEFSDMLDFSRVSFDKAFKTSIEKSEEVVPNGKYQFQSLENLLQKVVGYQTKIPKEEILEKGNNPVITQEQNVLISGYTNNKGIITDLPLIIFGDHSCTFKYLDFEFIRGADGTQLIKTDPNTLNAKFLFNYLLTLKIRNAEKYERHFKYLKTVKIPLPPLDIQKQIVAECEKIDNSSNEAQNEIENSKKQIEKLFENGAKNATTTFRLSNKDFFKVNIGKRIVERELVENGKYPVFSANVFEPVGKINKDLPIKDLDFSIPSVLWGIDGDWQVNYISENLPFYPTDHCGVLRVITKDVEPKYLAWALNEAGKYQRFSRTIRASIDRIESLSIKVPSIKEQQSTVKKVENCESKIAEAQKIIENSAEQKRKILEKYLN